MIDIDSRRVAPVAIPPDSIATSFTGVSPINPYRVANLKAVLS